MILTVTLNPCIDSVLFVDGLKPFDANRVLRVERDAGGKGVNLSRVVDELGGETTATGFLGGATGAFVQTVLERQGVAHSFVTIQGETRTNFSVEDGSGKPPTVFNQPGPPVSEAEWLQLVAWIEANVARFSWMVLAGSMPPGVPADAYRILGDIARQQGIPFMLDADGDAQRQGLKATPNFIKPNDSEASRLLGRPVDSDEECLSAVKDLQSMVAPGGIVVLSRGKRGAILAQSGKTWIGKSPEVKAVSTVGSGDSMIGGILWALGEGKPIDEAFRWGLAAGAATAATDGSEIARRATIEQLFKLATAQPA